MLTINGRVRLRRRRWHSPGEGTTTPLDRWMDTVEATISLGVREMACRLNGDGKDFDKAAADLARTAQVRLSGETLRVLVEAEGKRVLQAQRSERLPVAWSATDCPIEPKAKTTRLYLGSDGVMVPLVSAAEKTTRRQAIKQERRRRGETARPLPPKKPGADRGPEGAGGRQHQAGDRGDRCAGGLGPVDARGADRRQRRPGGAGGAARGSLRGRTPELKLALRGLVTDHHRSLLRTLLRQVEQLEGLIAEYAARIEEMTAPFAEAAARLESIPGLGGRAAEVIVAEIGTDMTASPTAGHLAQRNPMVAWARFLSPDPALAEDARRGRAEGPVRTPPAVPIARGPRRPIDRRPGDGSGRQEVRRIQSWAISCRSGSSGAGSAK